METTKQRRLILVRHAKALEDAAGGDHARRLNPRGQEDAAALGAWLAANHYRPEQVMCSTAARTRETLALISDGFNSDPSVRGESVVNLPTLLRDKLYLASANDMLAQLQAADDAVSTLMVLGHNPGMHGLLALLAGEFGSDADADKVIMKFPTAACAVLSFNAASWRNVTRQSGKLEALRWPADGN